MMTFGEKALYVCVQLAYRYLVLLNIGIVYVCVCVEWNDAADA